MKFLLTVKSVRNINVIAYKPPELSVFEGERVNNLMNYLTFSDTFHIVFGHGWGHYTSWYLSLSNVSSSPIALDSLYASILAQIGLIGSIIMMLFMWWLFSQGGSKGLFLLVVFGVIGLQMNVFEYYPANLLILLALGMLISERKNSINKARLYLAQARKDR